VSLPAGLSNPKGILRALYGEAAAALDGARVMERADELPRPRGPWRVLAFGKVAWPMWQGLESALARKEAKAIPDRVLLVTTDGGAAEARQATAEDPTGPSRNVGRPRFTGGQERASAGALVDVVASDHPEPTARSEAAAARIRAFVEDLPPEGHLTVLLSGGASSLVAEALPGVGLGVKRRITRELARAGAPIGELNVVRKQLSRIKGGRLGRLARVPVDLLVLADVVGDDEAAVLATVGSGPFTPDTSTFEDAEALLRRYDVRLPPLTATAWAAAARAEPPARSLGHVKPTVLAGPADLARAATEAAAWGGYAVEALPQGTEADVEALAETITGRLAAALRQRDVDGVSTPSIFVGYGEPRIALPPHAGQGGRASHLTWAVARLVDRWPAADRARVAFLAAATDDRDGASTAQGAVADGGTFARARLQGLAPERYGGSFDTASFFLALGDEVHGPGRSNVLDLHLAWVA
jgi:hydroxypyruvate reductase